ncbi:MAG: DNA translocase FtsK [Candidatus Roizmanbacteria bacterium]|nr:DNA translocase FtsK [Candidatus Roizmanbacteria bacterium]
MGRKKAIKIPFTKTKIKSNTVFSVFSLLLFLTFVLLMFSFNHRAQALNSVQRWMLDSYGRGAFLFPFIFLLLAGLFIQTKKLKIVKPNWFIGYVLLFVSYLAIFQAGSIGENIFVQTSFLISAPGALATYFVVFLIGLLIMFELSIHEFLQLVVTIGKQVGKIISLVFTSKPSKKAASNKDDFVGDSQAMPVLPFKLPHDQKQVSAQQELPVDTKFKSGIAGISKNWKFPSTALLDDPKNIEADRGDVKKNSDGIEEALESFGIRARVLDINYGPAVTQYALQIAKGVKLNKITSLSNNLALALAAPNGQIRIEAPIPGKALVGVEVPNIKAQTVTLKQMLTSPLFADRSKLLQVPMGLDVTGQPVSIEIDSMPHILVAGTTGSGKSVCLSSWICTFLYRTTPDEVKLLLIDPKRVTFSMFDGIPHLLTNIVTNPKDTISALQWAVNQMDERLKILAEAKCRDIQSYNESAEKEEIRMPRIIIIIDELADLMMYASKEVEDTITRIAQMARAVGIHLVLATQRPSVDVITGLMKANIPARVSFNVSSMIDSRVIIDTPGAEKLLGKGDMLFVSPSQQKPVRIQSPFVSEPEIKRIVEHFKKVEAPVHYTEEVTQGTTKSIMDSSGKITFKSANGDPLFADAVRLVCQHRKASASFFQRFLSVGYSRAARLLDDLEREGVVGPSNGSKPREVLVRAPEEVLGTPQ